MKYQVFFVILLLGLAMFIEATPKMRQQKSELREDEGEEGSGNGDNERKSFLDGLPKRWKKAVVDKQGNLKPGIDFECYSHRLCDDYCCVEFDRRPKGLPGLAKKKSGKKTYLKFGKHICACVDED